MALLYKKQLQPIAWEALPALVLPPHFSPATHDAFQVLAADGGKQGLFTGYYEPELHGARTPSARFCHPVYQVPHDFASLRKPYFARAEIDAGALAGKGLELLYVDDAVDLFFMHIQGSGCIVLEDGTRQRVGFAAKNGHPYTAIGKLLREKNALQPAITMQSIKAWLRAHPQEIQTILHHNASYIFFKLLEGDGPVGASGDVLKPEVSLAVDDTIWPYGLDVIVATSDPLQLEKPFIRCMKTADTGSAIRGLIRGDIYFGSGAAAGEKAGRMQAQGTLYVLIKQGA